MPRSSRQTTARHRHHLRRLMCWAASEHPASGRAEPPYPSGPWGTSTTCMFSENHSIGTMIHGPNTARQLQAERHTHTANTHQQPVYRPGPSYTQRLMAASTTWSWSAGARTRPNIDGKPCPSSTLTACGSGIRPCPQPPSNAWCTPPEKRPAPLYWAAQKSWSPARP